jgi:acetolactate synthase I/II/III large subunit
VAERYYTTSTALLEALAEAGVTHIYANPGSDHPMHQGWQFTTTAQNPLLAAADVVLVLDSDIPYIESNNKPSDHATLYVIDIDPIKTGMSLWHVPAKRSAAANSKVALGQIAAYVQDHLGVDLDLVETRRAQVTAEHEAQQAAWEALEHPENGVITPAYLTACVRDLLAGEDAQILTETGRSAVVAAHLPQAQPPPTPNS